MMVADSDVLIDALRGRNPAQARISAEIQKGSLATTAISVFELLSGAKSASTQDKVRRLLGALTILALDDRAGEAAAEVRRNLEASGAAVGMADYLIAGVCLTHSATLLTRNLKHFGRVPGLLVGTL
jgi:tRNA(fMet)-specific endonuclease VapC